MTKTERNWIILVLGITALSCQRYLTKDYAEQKVKSQYDEGVKATQSLSSLPIMYDLWSPTLDSTKMSWKRIHGRDYVLAVMWKKATDTAYYKNDCATGFYNTRNRYN